MNLSNIPEEKENPKETLNPLINSTHSLYYYCPKCGGNVEGDFGVRDSQGGSWAVSTCLVCGYKYKVRIR